jgi:hypothetical protein
VVEVSRTQPAIPRETIVCSSKGQALQFAYGLEILRRPSLPAVDGYSIKEKYEIHKENLS